MYGDDLRFPVGDKSSVAQFTIEVKLSFSRHNIKNSITTFSLSAHIVLDLCYVIIYKMLFVSLVCLWITDTWFVYFNHCFASCTGFF